jgi:serine phosphatase RsbU (regulator of sigma subunit)
LIDDEPAIRDMFAMYLRRLGHEVSSAEDGRSGLASCERIDPELVLCDLRMPGMDGIEVLATITRERPETPVIVVSGMGGMVDAIQALKLGAWDYVTKPVEDLAVLDHAIRGALERARLRVENRAYRQHLEEVNAKLEASLRQLEEDEAAGRKIQFRLLPEERVALNGYVFSRHLVTSAFLSGDFVDYFVIDQDRCGFYMADVSGHGVSSAFITVLLKSYMGGYLERFRQFGDRSILDPAAVLQGLNQDILAGRHGKYLTMFYGVLDRIRGRLDFANGGQFPLPILCDGNRSWQVGARSPAVGLFEDAHYATESVELPPAFGMVLFSDGILETLPQAGLAEKQAYLLSLASSESDASALARSLRLDELDAPLDDVSVLTLRAARP